MTLKTAKALWGADVVARALAEEGESLSPALVGLVDRQARDSTDREFARWALELDWPRFVAVVRIVSGEAGRQLSEEA